MIPDEAVEAAAMAHQGRRAKLGYPEWGELNDMGREWRLEHMRAALEAAAPFIQAQALLDAVDAFPLETITAPDNAVMWLRRRAEQIS